MHACVSVCVAVGLSMEVMEGEGGEMLGDDIIS